MTLAFLNLGLKEGGGEGHPAMAWANPIATLSTADSQIKGPIVLSLLLVGIPRWLLGVGIAQAFCRVRG